MIQSVASSAFEADDAESLRAALSVFEDWDSDLTALFQLGKEATTSYKRETKHTKLSETVVPYKQRRDSRKQEIAALRAQVDELETVVALEKALIKQPPPPPLTDESVEAVALRNEWERIATNQHHERLAAEVENAKLRELVESQVKNAEQILKLTKRVNQLESALPASPAVSFDNFKGPNVDVQTQLRRLDTMLPRAAELFATGAFADQQRDCFHEVHFCENARDLRGVGIQFEASWLLPFETERVADALWVHTVRPTFKNKKSVYMDIHEDTNCLSSQFISTPGLKEGWGASQGQFTARRLPPDLGDSSVLILITIQARAYLASSWQGSADVEGWLRIESVPSHNVQPMTRVKWYRHTLLQPPEVEIISKTELSKWISAVISGPTRSKFEKDIEWSVQALENMLLSPKPVV